MGDCLPNDYFTGYFPLLTKIEVLTTILNRHGSLFVHFPFFEYCATMVINLLGVEAPLMTDRANILAIILECDLLSYESRRNMLSTIICDGWYLFSSPMVVIETIRSSAYRWSSACTNMIKLGNPDIEKQKQLISPWMIVVLCACNINGMKTPQVVIHVANDVMAKFLTCNSNTDKLRKVSECMPACCNDGYSSIFDIDDSQCCLLCWCS